MAPPQLYIHWISSPCRGVIMACRKAGIDVEYKFVDLMSGEQKSEAFTKINPDQCVPTLVDDDFVLWESRALAKYMMSKFAPGHALYPNDVRKRALVDKMLDFDMGTVYKAILSYVYPRAFKNEEAPATEMEEMLTRLNDKVFNDKNFATGNTMTLADLFIVGSITFSEIVGYSVSKERFPNVAAWLERMKGDAFYAPANAEYEDLKKQFMSQKKA